MESDESYTADMRNSTLGRNHLTEFIETSQEAALTSREGCIRTDVPTIPCFD